MHPSPRKKIVVLSVLFLATLGSYWLVKKSNRFSGIDEMGQRSIASKSEANKSDASKSDSGKSIQSNENHASEIQNGMASGGASGSTSGTQTGSTSVSGAQMGA